MSLLIFIAILVALIWVHELGHFSAAKWFGIRVDEFAIGFPPRLLRVKYGETEYTFNLLLLGGFVRIHGEDSAAEGARDPRSMARKPRPVQALVLAAGIIMNLLFGWVALSAGYISGMPATPDSVRVGTIENVSPIIASVAPGSPAEKTGMLPGDTLKKVSSATSELPRPLSAAAVTEYIGLHQNESIILTVDRAGEEKVFIARPAEGLSPDKKVLGIAMADVGTLTLPPHLALVQGGYSAVELTARTAEGLLQFFGTLFTGRADFSSVAGPVGIAGAGASAVNEGFAAAAFLTALISINLALINVLPIPGLDGGRLFILAIESVIRRPLPARATTALSLTGFALIVLLMIVVTYHDITRLLV